jgi:hypothetical protein
MIQFNSMVKTWIISKGGCQLYPAAGKCRQKPAIEVYRRRISEKPLCT